MRCKRLARLQGSYPEPGSCALLLARGEPKLTSSDQPQGVIGLRCGFSRLFGCHSVGSSHWRVDGDDRRSASGQSRWLDGSDKKTSEQPLYFSSCQRDNADISPGAAGGDSAGGWQRGSGRLPLGRIVSLREQVLGSHESNGRTTAAGPLLPCGGDINHMPELTPQPRGDGAWP